MDTGKITKTEGLLLALTGVFLCALLVLFVRDRAALADLGVETAVEVPREELQPELTPVDLNTADAAELAELPGIGEKMARRILEYREEHGPFESVEELMEVSGIGEAKFADLEGWITVNGERAE